MEHVPGHNDSTTTSYKQRNQNNQKSKMMRVKIRQKRHMIILIWTLWFSYMSVTGGQVESQKPKQSNAAAASETVLLFKDHYPTNYYGRLKRSNSDDDSVVRQQSLLLLGENNSMMIDLVGQNKSNCTSPAILDFPTDLFTQQERRQGFVIIHFIASMYVFYALGIVCDDYFVSSIEAICEALVIPSDVAGATFMAIASSSPELFTNVISTFITDGDIGVGTIVGSAVFNIFGVCACCGFAAKKALPLDWYALVRDSTVYIIAVMLLIRVLRDGRIFFLEALVFVVAYIVYIGIMWKNASLKRLVYRVVRGVRRKFCFGTTRNFPETQFDPLFSTEKDPLLLRSGISKIQGEKDLNNRILIVDDDDDNLFPTGDDQEEEDEDCYDPFMSPKYGTSCLGWLDWLMGWPARFLFYLTIPNCRTVRFRRFYVVTLLACIIYIGLLTYVVTWLMTIIGHTFKAPDSVMGLTFIAVGNSVPEAVSSIVVARQGLVSMSISNSIGSNTFDILMCLGLPWLIRTFMIAKNEVNYVQINSGGLEYSAIFLMASVPLLYVILASNKFYLDKKVATISIITYAIFLVLSSLVELNTFSKVNVPTCPIPGE